MQGAATRDREWRIGQRAREFGVETDDGEQIRSHGRRGSSPEPEQPDFYLQVWAPDSSLQRRRQTGETRCLQLRRENSVANIASFQQDIHYKYKHYSNDGISSFGYYTLTTAIKDERVETWNVIILFS